MLVVGTSGVVYPAALMPLFAREAGATVVDVNPERDALTANATSSSGAGRRGAAAARRGGARALGESTAG